MATINNSKKEKAMNKNNVTSAYGTVTVKDVATIQFSTNSKNDCEECSFTVISGNRKKVFTFYRSLILEIKSTNLDDGTTDPHLLIGGELWKWAVKFVQHYPLLEQYYYDGDSRELVKEEISVYHSCNDELGELCTSWDGNLILRLTHSDNGRMEEIAFPYQVVKQLYEQLYALGTRIIAEEEEMMIEEEVIASHEEFEEYLEFCCDHYDPFSGEHPFDAWQNFLEESEF